ncbi:DUF4233 domain-containing protein [Auraticoccus sp. F435]|uniref:DUF4233 domain-containing protein n=2 Tax=Auraticoccus cholistanensis TaxID=2656650 RepID=A0A6A9V203_9ACTN|nr:DUF4233 domain-containing protein [Auraticoccus cholistanensis]MVA77625.1 DUF4233 domain-containing protein [Auraticoccus cholistanensis]
MTKVLVAVVAFEVVVFGLAVFVMLQVSSVPVQVAVPVCAAAALLAVVSAGTMRRPLGQWLGWLCQLVGLAMGLLTPAMFIMGGLFALLWVATFVLGRRLDAQADGRAGA